MLWKFPMASWAIVTMWGDLSVSDILCHRITGQAAANEQSCTSPPPHCTWRLFVEYLAMRSAPAPSVSPPAERLSACVKESMRRSRYPNVKKWPGDLEANQISQCAFHISKSSHRTSSFTPWSWLHFLSLGLPGFCLWSLNLGAVICQQR